MYRQYDCQYPINPTNYFIIKIFFSARVLALTDENDGVSGELTVKVDCHYRGEYILEILAFHPDICHGAKFQLLTSYLITVK